MDWITDIKRNKGFLLLELCLAVSILLTLVGLTVIPPDPLQKKCTSRRLLEKWHGTWLQSASMLLVIMAAGQSGSFLYPSAGICRSGGYTDYKAPKL